MSDSNFLRRHPHPNPLHGEEGTRAVPPGGQRAGRLPLEGVRVLDSTYVFALPYAGGLLADMGAEVIKVEGPGRPDVTRTGGYSGVFAENDIGEDWWNRPSTYNLIHRGKQSITLDMTDERGRDLFKELVMVSDVVMENFTPRVMRSWGLDYPNLRKLRPDVILVSNTGYGHGGGPYSGYPAQATTQEATHGHCWVTGYPGEGPAKAGASFVDFLSTWTALLAIGAALRYRSRTGLGQWVDMGMYQAGVMFLSEYILDATANGREGGRIGNRHPWRAPQGCYPAAGDDQWITLSVGDDSQWRSLCEVMGQPELASDPRFASLLGRRGEPRRAGRVHRGVDLGTGPLRHHARAAGGGHPVGAGADGARHPLRPALQEPQLPGAGAVSTGARDGRAGVPESPVQVLQESAAHPGAVASLRAAQRGCAQGAAGRLRGDLPATGGGRGDHHGADHRGAVAGDAAG